jgi:hypothetical protein
MSRAPLFLLTPLYKTCQAFGRIWVQVNPKSVSSELAENPVKFGFRKLPLPADYSFVVDWQS